MNSNRYCSHCNYPIEQGQLFCANCGMKVEKDEKKSLKIILITTCLGVACLVAVITIAFFLNRINMNRTDTVSRRDMTSDEKEYVEYIEKAKNDLTKLYSKCNTFEEEYCKKFENYSQDLSRSEKKEKWNLFVNSDGGTPENFGSYEIARSAYDDVLDYYKYLDDLAWHEEKDTYNLNTLLEKYLCYRQSVIKYNTKLSHPSYVSDYDTWKSYVEAWKASILMCQAELQEQLDELE